ncbi:MAG: DUF3047 domain-containing protein [Chromatiales bacterium]|nr:DUF3047 domain-containing protein [Chromatiales bacterium]
MRPAAALLILLPVLVLALEEHVFGDFADGMDRWSERSFVGRTQYRMTEVDGRAALEAHARTSASALYRDERVDLRRTPCLQFDWRIERTLGDDLDERSKSGDDYAARIYVVRRGGLAFWRTRALNYVWSGSEPVGARWPNAYAGRNAQMWVLDSGNDLAGQWVSHARDVRADWLESFGEEIDSLDGLALMTDADDSGGEVRAWYADIRFTGPGGC